MHFARLPSGGWRCDFDWRVLFGMDYGMAVPDLDFTVEISELLIKPLTVTSVRKLLELATVPLCAFVWLISELLTALLEVVSPRSTLIGTATLPVVTPSLP